MKQNQRAKRCSNFVFKHDQYTGIGEKREIEKSTEKRKKSRSISIRFQTQQLSSNNIILFLKNKIKKGERFFRGGYFCFKKTGRAFPQTLHTLICHQHRHAMVCLKTEGFVREIKAKKRTITVVVLGARTKVMNNQCVYSSVCFSILKIKIKTNTIVYGRRFTLSRTLLSCQLGNLEYHRQMI